MTPLRAVFFDVGETLVYPHPSPSELMAATCREMGFEVSAAEIVEAEVAVAPLLLERQRNATELYSISEENSRRFWTWFYGRLLDHLKAPDALREDLAERFHRCFNTVETWHLYPGAIEALEALQSRRKAGLQLGVISNWEGWLEALLAHLAIDRYFDFTVISATVRIEKPDPAIFRAALDRAGVQAAEALHIGDSVPADVIGAYNVGIIPVLIDRRGRYAIDRSGLPETTLVVDHLAAIPAIVDRLA
jgi:putative hydrolase of the HAD superfamily